MMTALRHKDSVRLKELLAGIASVPDSAFDLPITGVTQDSRQVQAGTLFIARCGERSHGLDYLDEVLEKGCVAIVYEPDKHWTFSVVSNVASKHQLAIIPVEDLRSAAGMIAARFYDEPSTAMEVIGITGTNGKTSCAWLLSHALNARQKSAMIGTLGIGTPGNLATATHTTPDAVSVQKLLAEMRQNGCRAVAMEVSSHAMEQGRVEGVVFDVALFTNLSQDHLDYHGTMEAYGAAKSRLFATANLKKAVVNLDDAFAQSIIDQLNPKTQLIPFSAKAHKRAAVSGLVAENIETIPTGLVFDMLYKGERVTMHSSLIGRFNVDNLLGAAGVLIALGYSLKYAVTLLSQVPPVPGRMQVMVSARGVTAIIDYAHTPDALEKALQACRQHAKKQLWCLFGCGGNRDKAKRPMMGAVAEKNADHVMLTNDNPRSESPRLIIGQILEGLAQPDVVMIELDRAKAIESMLLQAGADDIVLIAGKGHEDYQLIGKRVLHFSDQEVVQRCFSEMDA